MTRSELPAWPAMLDLALALAYTTLGEDSFRSVMARGGVRPVDLGTSQLRWRRADIDAAIDKLPVRAPKLPPGETPAPGEGAQVVHLVDPAQAALERARRRVRR